MFERYVAIGDSFTEGVGDVQPGGGLRGWADMVALGLAGAAGAPSGVAPGGTAPAPFSYANLAIRGKLLGPIVDGQLDAALALSPDLLSVCGGGNDVMRPRVEMSTVVGHLQRVVDRAERQGAHVLMLVGANPTRHLPLGSLIARRGDRLTQACRAAFVRPGITFVDNWADTELAELRYWSEDRLHLNSLGHARVASNVLTALGLAVPAAEIGAATPAAAARTPAYYREHVIPWIGRRLTGRSSGDGRTGKRPTLQPVDAG
ncbi:MAG: SGNH/GDSL hydrolase family protein [Cryobacterium sp.]